MTRGQRTPTHDLRPLRSLFRAPLMPAREYVEAEVLGQYVWSYHSGVLSTDERVAIRSALMEGKSTPIPPGAFSSDSLPEGTRERLVRNIVTAWRLAGERLLREHYDSIFINRCPRCSRIAKTPLAQQCTWCRHDWHGPSAG
jgi:hypothetical protein